VSGYLEFGLIVLWLGGRLLNGKRVENAWSKATESYWLGFKYCILTKIMD